MSLVPNSGLNSISVISYLRILMKRVIMSPKGVNFVNKMKKLLVCFLIIFGFVVPFCRTANASSVREIKNRGYVKVSTNAEWEPFEYKDGDDIVGIDIEIAQKIADKLGVQLKNEDVSYDALTLELSKRKCDFVIAGWSSSEEKEKVIDFSDSYYKSKQVIIIPIGSFIHTKEDLHGKKIGVQLGTTGDIHCTKYFPDSEICRYDTGSEPGMQLAAGNIDAVVIDELQARKSVNLFNDALKIPDTYLFEEDYKIAVPKGDSELLGFINSVLKEIKSSGELDAIIEKYTSVQPNRKSGLLGQIYNNLIYKDRYMLILSGLLTTFEITLAALAIGFIIGIFVALAKISKSDKLIFKILRNLANFYSTIIRGTPLVVQLFVMYYFILDASGFDKIVVAMIAFGINSGAYVAEHIKSGILSVEHGQYEAGRSLGLSSSLTMRKIILPQAVKNVFPTLVTEFINLIKETSVAGFIGVVDLSRSGNIIRSQTFEPMVPLLTVALIYLVVIMVLTAFMTTVERRLRRSDSR